MQFHYHFAPAVGWMNDPNGLIDVDGTHHLFFQYDPYSADQGPDGGNITWGHATSTDFVHWVQHTNALVPGDVGAYDDEGCWSGCAVRLDDGRTAVIYSGNTSDGQLPCVAFADDDSLISWTKSSANPVIEAAAPISGITDFRDHTILRRGDLWHQWIAVGGEKGGTLVEYTSADLLSWEYQGVFLAARDWGLPDGVWECPDVFEIDGSTVIIVSWYTDTDRDTIWITGHQDDDRFIPERWGTLDLGELLYAPQSYTSDDGRRILFGWLMTRNDPASQGQVNAGAQSVPRAVRATGGILTQEPVEEITALTAAEVGTVTVQDSAMIPVNSLEALTVTLSGHDLARTAGVVLIDAEGTAFDLPISRLKAPTHFTLTEEGWSPRVNMVAELRVLFDRGLVEIFAGDGRAVAASDLTLSSVATVLVYHQSPGGHPVTATVAALTEVPGRRQPEENARRMASPHERHAVQFDVSR